MAVRSVLTILNPTTAGNVSTPGLSTNVVPKGQAPEGLVDSSRSDDGTTVTETLPIDYQGNNAIHPNMVGYTEQAIRTVGGAVAIDMRNTNAQEITMAGNTAITITHAPGGTVEGRLTLVVIDTPGGSAITFPNPVNFGAAGAPPALAAGGGIVISVISVFGGSLWGSWVTGF